MGDSDLETSKAAMTPLPPSSDVDLPVLPNVERKNNAASTLRQQLQILHQKGVKSEIKPIPISAIPTSVANVSTEDKETKARRTVNTKAGFVGDKLVKFGNTISKIEHDVNNTIEVVHADPETSSTSVSSSVLILKKSATNLVSDRNKSGQSTDDNNISGVKKTYGYETNGKASFAARNSKRRFPYQNPHMLIRTPFRLDEYEDCYSQQCASCGEPYYSFNNRDDYYEEAFHDYKCKQWILVEDIMLVGLVSHIIDSRLSFKPTEESVEQAKKEGKDPSKLVWQELRSMWQIAALRYFELTGIRVPFRTVHALERHLKDLKKRLKGVEADDTVPFFRPYRNEFEKGYNVNYILTCPEYRYHEMFTELKSAVKGSHPNCPKLMSVSNGGDSLGPSLAPELGIDDDDTSEDGAKQKKAKTKKNKEQTPEELAAEVASFMAKTQNLNTESDTDDNNKISVMMIPLEPTVQDITNQLRPNRQKKRKVSRRTSGASETTIEDLNTNATKGNYNPSSQSSNH